MRKPLPGINEKGKGSMNLVENFFKNYQNLPVLLSEVIQERDAYLCKSFESQLKTAVDLEEKLSKLHESSSLPILLQLIPPITFTSFQKKKN